jgi:hypothetical protein
VLPSKRSIRHIAPSLWLFVPNSLTVNHHSFFSESSARDVFLWLSLLSCGDYAPAATTAPSLRAARPERCQQIQAHQLHPNFRLSLSLFQRWPELPHFRLSYAKHVSVSSTVSEGADPSTTSSSSLSVTRWTCRLLVSQSPSPMVYPRVSLTFPVLSRRTFFRSPFLRFLRPSAA